MRLLDPLFTLLALSGFSLAQDFFIQLSSSATACKYADYGTAYVYGSDVEGGDSSPCQNIGGYPIANGIRYCGYFDYDDPDLTSNCNGAIPFKAHSVTLTKAVCGLFTEKDCTGDEISVKDNGVDGCTDLQQSVQSFICTWDVILPDGPGVAIDK
ncbi:hypothetical protein F5Y18DRAFT_377891 [Xylariaceae sp. FL1019]|nr:hypothetical protein F5Y18DRAFT_377891 [Xylariaceae sp. FL1019]